MLLKIVKVVVIEKVVWLQSTTLAYEPSNASLRAASGNL
jgi:hypothetical protein